MKKIIAILLCMILVLGSSALTVFAEADTAKVSVTETKLDNGLYKLEFGVIEGIGVYGVSLDMVYDQSKLEVVTAAGNGTAIPMMSVPGFFGPGITDKTLSDATDAPSIGDAYTAVNIKNGNQLSFVRLLAGDSQGVNFSTVRAFGEIYFKVKAGQTFDGFGNFTLASDLASITPGKICIKVVDAAGVSLIPTLSQGPLGLKLILVPTELTPDDTSKFLSNVAELIVKRGNTVLKTITFTANALGANNGTQLQFYGETSTLPNLAIGDTYYVKIKGFKSQVKTLTDPGSAGGSLSLTLNILLGNMNGDNLIDATDVALFGLDYGKTASGLVADFNKDGVVNVKDLYFLGKNIE